MCKLSIFVVCIVYLYVSVHAGSADTEWYFNNWCGKGDMQYLQDAQCAKLFPQTINRNWACPIPVLQSAPDGYSPDKALLDNTVDTETLGSLITDHDINLCVIVTKRVADASAVDGFRLYNKYLCAGDRSAAVPYETWSSSKVFAMANAAGRLRSNESHCGAGDASNLQYGLDGTVTGKHGRTLLGDLATVICSYDQTAGYTSNSLASYFHDFGWRQRLYDLVQSWLLVSDKGATSAADESTRDARVSTQGKSGNLTSEVQSLGGNYGEATPSDLSFDVTASTGASDCEADKDPRLVTYTNTLSALSAAELVRRIALHREVPESLRFPNATWTDIQTILYGAEQSALFPGQAWGGMSADIAIFTQAGLDLPSLLQQWDPASLSQWRIFSKLGDGIELEHGEIVSNAYACIPRYDATTGAAQGGVEFTIAARGSVLGDSSLKATEAQLQAAMTTAIQYVLDHE